MRLLNTSTLQLVDFVRDIPLYAILSHTWGSEEVSLQDLQDPSGKAQRMVGFSKIQKSCQLARSYQFDYIWIDTCCINKESSAELSEAINSMYHYYRSSRVCYVYMSDVLRIEDPNATASPGTFRNSRWFTRGWTLQELLAPSSVIFFDQNWNDIGTKSSLANVLTVVTGIPLQILLGDLSVKVSIAARMSWAAKRQTTRSEDIAYCLMGIFGVNMPTLYGEGAQRAFIRLQEEIIKYSDDQSIFAWRVQSPLPAFKEFDANNPRGLFASSPIEFMDSGKLSVSSNRDVDASPYAMTNLGLHIHLPLISVDPRNRVYLAILNCNLRGRAVGIYLHRKYPLGLQFSRVKSEDVALEHSWTIPTKKQEIYVQQRNTSGTLDKLSPQQRSNHCDLEIRSLPSLCDFTIVKTIIMRFDAWRGLESWSFDGDVAPLDLGQQVNLQYRNNTTNERFVVTVGRGLDYELDADLDYIFWSKIVVDYSDELRESNGLVDVGTRRGLAFRNLSERDLQQLRRDEYVSVVVHRTGRQNLCIAEISLVNMKNPQAIVHVQSSPLEYGFELDSLRSSFSSEGFTVDLDNALPPNHYSREHRVLYLPRGGVGVVNVRDNTNTVILAIVMGIQGAEAWVDVVVHSHKEEEPTDSIWQSYSPIGKRSANPRSASRSTTVGGYDITITVVNIDSLSSHTTHILSTSLSKITSVSEAEFQETT